MENCINVIRLNHRIKRDERTTTHCILTARIFGVKNFFYSGDKDENMESVIKKLLNNWGGSINITYEKNPSKLFTFPTVHLTMYGERVEEKIDEIKKLFKKEKQLNIVIGSSKVKKWVYEKSTYNIAITNQPHSEITALALFLHLLLDGKELDKTFEENISKEAKIKIIPTKKGKRVIKLDKKQHKNL